MFDKFNFYDFLGYVLPGAAVSLTVYWVGKTAFHIPFPDLGADLTTSFVFLGISYVVGHLVQGLGSIYERGQLKEGKGLEEWLLMKDVPELRAVDRFPDDVVKRIQTIGKDVFGTGGDTEIFNEAYALIVQKSLAQHTEIFLAMKGLARGMLIATYIGLLIGALVAFEELLLRKYEWALVAGAAMLALVPIAVLFEREFNRFRMYFTKSVYWNVLAWYADKKMGAN